MAETEVWPMSRFVRSAALLALVGSLLSVPSAPAAPPDRDAPTAHYVALGDSFTSAPLSSRPVGEWGTSNDTDDPYDCGRSDRNYPHLVADHLGVYDPLAPEVVAAPEHGGALHPQFVDVSCGGADTEDMWQAQGGAFSGPFEGTNPPQFSAFDRVPEDGMVTLVTLGIGGNDLGFGELQDHCLQPPEQAGGTPCREYFEHHPDAGGGDLLRHRLEQLRPRLDAVIDGIRERAPHAEVLVFGYPALLPEEPIVPGGEEGCYPYIPILPEDVEYLRDIEKALNRTIADATTRAGVHYVDWYGPSIGHDMCRPPGVAWVNGAVVVPPSFPVHPNVLGSRGAAAAAVDVLDAIDFQLEHGRTGHPHAGRRSPGQEVPVPVPLADRASAE